MVEAGNLSVFYKDGSVDTIHLGSYFSGKIGEFSKLDIIIGNPTKTINYIKGCHNSGQFVYFDINTLSLVEEINFIDTPVEVQSVGDKTKNLFNINDYKIAGKPIFEMVDGKITLTATWENNIYYTIDSLKPNTTYTLSFASNYECVFYVDDATGTYKDKYMYKVNKNKYQLISTDSGVITIYFRNSIETNRDYQIWNIQLEEGNIATEYEPYGKYNIPITVSGRNLFNEKELFNSRGYNAGITVENIDGQIKMTGTATRDIYVSLVSPYADNAIEIPKEVLGKNIGVYVNNDRFSKNWRENIEVGFYKYVDGVRQGSVWTSVTERSVFVPKDCTHMEMRVRFINGETYDERFNVMLYDADAGVPEYYEPYVEPKTYNIYLDEPLRKVGEYADYIDFKEQKVVRQVSKRIIPSNIDLNLSADNWQKEGYTSWYAFVFDRSINTSYTMKNVLSNRFRGCGFAWGSAEAPYNYIGYGGIGYILYFIISNDYTGITASDDLETQKTKIKNWLSANDTELYYPLFTPKEESIELPAIQKFEGTNVIKVDTSIQANMLVRYNYEGTIVD